MFWKCFGFKRRESLILKIKGIFWINYVCIKAFASLHAQGYIYIMTSLQEDIHITTYLQRGICIIACPRESICINAYLQEDIRIIAYPHGHLHRCIPKREHSHHDIPTMGHSHHKHTPKRTFASWHAPRGHLHHDVPTRSICIMTYPLEGICTTRFFASLSL